MPGRVPGSVEPVDPEVATPKGIVLTDRRFEYRQGRRRLGTVAGATPVAAQAAGTNCTLFQSCVGTPTQRCNCDVGLLALRLGS